MKKISTLTLGCKVNQYETEAIINLFKNKGYYLSKTEFADIYLINTCTVTNLSDRKSRQYIRRAKKTNPNSIVVVAGCYSQVSPEEISKIQEVDIIVGTDDKKQIVELCENYMLEREKINIVKNIKAIKEFEEINSEGIHENTRAFLKIQDGCNQFCTYCIIPYARGRIRSRQPENIIKEVKNLIKRNYKEIVLTGIHIASYGKDLKENIELIDIIERISQFEEIKRIRLSSIEPNIITDDFLGRYKKIEKACSHFHLSLQSGSDTVLKRMNRKYTAEEYYKSVKKLKNEIEDIALTTDIIVGFPGETDIEFKETYEFAKKIGFSKIHVFQYSPRKGTPAAEYKDQVKGEIKQERSKRLIELADELSLEFNRNHIGKEMEVLFEEENSEGFIEGYTSNYIRVMAKGNIKEIENTIRKVKMKELHHMKLKGEIL